MAERVESLQEFLRRKKTESDDRKPSPRQTGQWKEEYLASLRRLFEDIDGWLCSSIDDGTIERHRGKVPLQEPQLGEYEAPSLEVVVGEQHVSFDPVGQQIIGGRGRVDVSCGRKRALLVLKDAGEWFIVTRFPRNEYLLDEDGFSELLKTLLE